MQNTMPMNLGNTNKLDIESQPNYNNYIKPSLDLLTKISHKANENEERKASQNASL